MGQLYTFSDDAKFLALVDQMGALTIWDTATNALKQKYSPNFHLMGQVTTLTWATTLPEPTKKVNALILHCVLMYPADINVEIYYCFRKMPSMKGRNCSWCWEPAKVNYICTPMPKAR